MAQVSAIPELLRGRQGAEMGESQEPAVQLAWGVRWRTQIPYLKQGKGEDWHLKLLSDLHTHAKRSHTEMCTHIFI